jgi:hypothetical protein
MELQFKSTTKQTIIYAVVALILSIAIYFSWEPVSYEEHLVRIQAKNELGEIDTRILDEPIAIQAILLDYSISQELMLKAWFAISKYPEPSHEIFTLYGSEPEFKEILLKYGDVTIPIIGYFMENGIWSSKTMNFIGEGLQNLTSSAHNLLSNQPDDPLDTMKVIVETPDALRSEALRIEDGWTAVNYIKEEGYDFIRQFTISSDNEVTWNQTKRFAEGITSLLTSGVSKLEQKLDLDEDLLAQDYFWAAMDVVPVIAAFKVLKAGKVVARSGKALSTTGKVAKGSGVAVSKSAKALTLSERTVLIAGSTSKLSKIVLKKGWGKWGLRLGAGIILIKAPRMVSALLAMAARAIGLPAWLFQLVGWYLIIFILLYPFSWLIRKVLFGIYQILSWSFKASTKESIGSESQSLT